MSQRNEERTDIDRLRARARALFISQATIDDLLAWATPRQLQAVDRLLHTELDNRETSKRARLLRRARFPVPKTLDGYDFTNVKLPDGYARDELLSLDFVGRAQDLVFYGKTGRGKTHLATALGMSAIDRGMNVRFLPTAELVLQLGRAKREGTLETMCISSNWCEQCRHLFWTLSAFMLNGMGGWLVSLVVVYFMSEWVFR